MGVLSWIVLGLVAGLLAKIILPGKDPGGLFVTILIDIIGAGIMMPVVPYLVRPYSADALTIGLLAVAYSIAQLRNRLSVASTNMSRSQFRSPG